jgi:hypothetical protein
MKAKGWMRKSADDCRLLFLEAKGSDVRNPYEE